jgi:hypothetical protein
LCHGLILAREALIALDPQNAMLRDAFRAVAPHFLS